jgi:hypothetical protein
MPMKEMKGGQKDWKERSKEVGLNRLSNLRQHLRREQMAFPYCFRCSLHHGNVLHYTEKFQCVVVLYFFEARLYENTPTPNFKKQSHS